MIVSTYHAHSIYSDGKNTLEEMVLSAINCGMKEIGFTDHAPMQFFCDWSMDAKNVENYKNEVLMLKEKHTNIAFGTAVFLMFLKKTLYTK